MKSIYILLALSTFACAALTEEQQRVPLEQNPADPKLTKIVLVAGSASNKPGQHEYFAGCALMMDWLRQTPGVWPVMAADGWPKDERSFEGAKTVVIYADAGAKLPFLDPARWARIKSLMDAGTGLVALHQAVEVPAAQAAEYKSWLGGVWQPDIGSRGTGTWNSMNSQNTPSSAESHRFPHRSTAGSSISISPPAPCLS